jgi:hypothetical protein
MWRCSWENEKGGIEFVDAGPLDVVSFPPGVARRFENVTPGDPDEESILMFVIGGDGPKAEFTDQSMEILEVAGRLEKAIVNNDPDATGFRGRVGECPRGRSGHRTFVG